ncbi:hypothetical protein ACIQ6K_39180 [Streptomyces sp. NPDC096354]|uniref:hypothetical protein n=1 Tax=Streptomyces sp. NPDC096354 TaxID=3366088 RepID=UPI0037FE2AE2
MPARPSSLTPKQLTITDSTRFSFLRNEVRGHYGSGPQHVEELTRLASTGRLGLEASITAHIPLADAAGSVTRLERKEGDPIRLVLIP